MSIPVKIEDLAKTLDDFDNAYLLTASEDGIKVVNVELAAEGDGLRVTPGSKGTVRNLTANPRATVMCPPRQARGWTLIVDGTAEPAGDGFRFTPTGAVLHRPAAHSDRPVTGDGCANDCKPVE